MTAHVVRCLSLACALFVQMAIPAQALTPRITAGNADGFAVLDANGVIRTTGNAHGNGSSSQPFRFQGIVDAKSISMGSDTFWIIRADDLLWGTGSNFHGELGTGNPGPTTFVTQPVKVLDSVKQVVQQGQSTCAIRTDGSLWAWGRNEQAQLGLGDQVDRAVPTQVSGVSNVVQVAADNGSHAVALTADGIASKDYLEFTPSTKTLGRGSRVPGESLREGDDCELETLDLPRVALSDSSGRQCSHADDRGWGVSHCF